IVGAIYFLQQSGEKPVANAAGKGGGKAAKENTGKLVLEWSEEDRKNGFAVLIDDKRQLTLSKGELSFDLKPGDHKVLMQRRGYAQVETTVSIKEGESTSYKPVWTKDEFGAAGGSVATKSVTPN